MICASLYRAVFNETLLRYHAEKILRVNTTNFERDYHLIKVAKQIDRIVEAIAEGMFNPNITDKVPEPEARK